MIKETLLTAKAYSLDANKIENSGLVSISSTKVKPPRIKECKAHLEWTLEWTKKNGNEIIITGRVVSASADKNIIEAPLEERCKILKQILWAGPKGSL